MSEPKPEYDPHLFAQYASIVRQRIAEMGITAMKDPGFMQDWQRMMRFAPAGFNDDQKAIFRLGLIPLPSGEDAQGSPTWDWQDVADAMKVSVESLEASIKGQEKGLTGNSARLH